jgi:hypothetical protein
MPSGSDRLSRRKTLGIFHLFPKTLESRSTLLIVDSRTLDLSENNSVLMLDFEGILAKQVLVRRIIVLVHPPIRSATKP